MPNPKVNWQPLSFMPVLLEQITNQAIDLAKLKSSLESARGKPHVLDDFTVDRVKHVHTEQRSMMPVFREQCVRWRKKATAQKDLDAIQATSEQVERVDTLLGEIIELADELSKGTIDKILGMSDGELGLAFLRGQLPGGGPTALRKK